MQRMHASRAASALCGRAERRTARAEQGAASSRVHVGSNAGPVIDEVLELLAGRRPEPAETLAVVLPGESCVKKTGYSLVTVTLDAKTPPARATGQRVRDGHGEPRGMGLGAGAPASPPARERPAAMQLAQQSRPRSAGAHRKTCCQ